MKSWTAKDLSKQLERMGCSYIRSRGSHHVYKTPKGKMIVLVARRTSEELKAALVQNVKRKLAREGLELEV